MPELPIVKLARRLLFGNRPPGFLACAACRALVPPGEGFWDSGWKELACSESCAEDMSAEHSW